MKYITRSKLAQDAALGSRALEVQQDPAVQKAWSEATRDCKQAFTSVADALVETRGAWRRSAEQAVGGLVILATESVPTPRPPSPGGR